MGGYKRSNIIDTSVFQLNKYLHFDHKHKYIVLM